MKEYFLLQYRMINRHIRDFGLHPALGYLFSLLIFVAFSLFLFYKTEFAAYIYIMIALGPVIRLTDMQRSRFLQSCFSRRQYIQIRIAENGLIVLPFILFLLVKGLLIASLLLTALSVVFAMVSLKGRFIYALPTPFGRRPFEFASGFRNSWAFILISYLLTVASIVFSNFNLGVFSLLLLFLIIFTYYLNPENDFFVWIHAMTPGQFLTGKLRTALLYSVLLSSPSLLLSGIFYPGNLLILFGFFGLGYVYLSALILAKYASFPGQITLPVMILLAFSLTFPPLLGAIIPFLWIRSVRHLSPILS